MHAIMNYDSRLLIPACYIAWILVNKMKVFVVDEQIYSRDIFWDAGVSG